jgi:methyltransferase (TIGR00027 family)
VCRDQRREAVPHARVLDARELRPEGPHLPHGDVYTQRAEHLLGDCDLAVDEGAIDDRGAVVGRYGDERKDRLGVGQRHGRKRHQRKNESNLHAGHTSGGVVRSLWYVASVKERASFTAAWVAGCRSLGVVLPEEARIADDPYGARFAPPTMRAMIRMPALARAGLKRSIVYMQVRTRVLDDALHEFVRSGGDQVVLLGAGFDCRALRFAQELARATVFEVDHPATQAKKREHLHDDVGAHTEYVAWDFEQRNTSDLPAALAGYGHQKTKRTLTIWEGVTMYLTQDAIDASVRAVAAYSAPESRLAFTYFDRTFSSRPTLRQRLARQVVASVGEPFRFGWAPEDIAPYFGERGFRLVSDDDMRALAARLLPPAYGLSADAARRRIALVYKM